MPLFSTNGARACLTEQSTESSNKGPKMRLKPSKLLAAAKAIRPTLPGAKPAPALDKAGTQKSVPNVPAASKALPTPGVPVAQLKPLPSSPGPTALQRPEPEVKGISPADRAKKA